MMNAIAFVLTAMVYVFGALAIVGGSIMVGMLIVGLARVVQAGKSDPAEMRRELHSIVGEEEEL
jgi:uncharacterized membrane protein